MLNYIISESTYEIEDLAEKLGMSSRALNNRLNSKVQFRIGELYNLFRILDIKDPDILFTA